VAKQRRMLAACAATSRFSKDGAAGFIMNAYQLFYQHH
jgi:hypothetical protein